MSVVQLKQACASVSAREAKQNKTKQNVSNLTHEQKGLAVSGTRAQLIERLNNPDSG